MKKIYYRDEAEHNYLREKYPDVEAEFLKMPEDRKDATGPLVCNNDEPLDKCKMGEEFITE
jgi:hypothetical protein